MATFVPRSRLSRLRRLTEARNQQPLPKRRQLSARQERLAETAKRGSRAVKRSPTQPPVGTAKRFSVLDGGSSFAAGARQPAKTVRRSPRFRQLLPTAPIKVSRFRLILVWGILLLAGLWLALNLYRLQVLEASVLQERAQQQQTILMRPFVPRRPIVDRTGNMLAIDRPAYTLYAHPMLFKQDKQAIAERLSSSIDRSVTDLVKQFGTAESGIEIEYALPEETADKVSNLQLDGLELIEHPQRLYPQQDLFANVVGYVNVDRQGEAGLELGQRKLLERSTDSVRLSRAGDGSIMPDDVPKGFLHQDALRLQLTLDGRLQRVARFALHQQIEKFGAKRGAVMVMDDRDGSMLAMATEPTYDPNQYYKFDLERFRNWTVSDPYEPGSTFKPINVAIALQTGAVRLTDTFYDEGQITIGEWPIQNNDFEARGGRGTLTLTEVIKYSSNVGMVHVMHQVKPELYYNWLERIGLGKTIGIDLPDEIQGQIKSRKQFIGAAIEPATTAFGQGFTLTPIQLLQLHGMLANSGQMVTPHVVKGLFSPQGKPLWQPDLPDPRQIVFPQVAQTVLQMMEAVVQDGTGKAAQIPGYRIAGKTGTAQKASGGGYSNARITSFVSSFPVEAPRYTVLVVVDEPQGDHAFGSTVAAPVAKAVMEALIAIEHIPPSQPLSQQATSESQ
jgi:cell division protein FtsI (penicillin-binding protein 3)